ncbi:MAG: C10 family peptidase [Staphylococcus sp.]|nr:C10 family peptidase [Staphylococcus sp.]
MKTLIPFLAVGLLVASCSSDAVEEPESSKLDLKTVTTMTEKRSLDEAIQIANDARSLLDDGSKSSRASVARELDLSSGISYVTSGTSRSGDADTLLYVLNYKDNAGYAVICANRSGESLLAVTEAGHYTTAEECTNPGLTMFIDMAVAYSAGLPINPSNPNPNSPFEIQEVKREEIILDSVSVSPRVDVEWDQSGIYGKYCDNGLTGCSNTALGMAMSYFEYPKSIKLTYRNNEIIDLDWPNMKRHTIGTSDYCCQPNSPHDAIASLLREIGKRAGSEYKNSFFEYGTGTTENGIRQAALSFGFKLTATQSYYKQCIRYNLKDGIIIVGGFNENDMGHMWIADGFKYMKKQMIEYVRPISSLEWTEVENVISESMLSWFNWGWNGEDNGYFNDDVFHTQNGNFRNKALFFTVYL